MGGFAAAVGKRMLQQKEVLRALEGGVADKVNTEKYEVVPILQWLQRVNRKAREK